LTRSSPASASFGRRSCTSASVCATVSTSGTVTVPIETHRSCPLMRASGGMGSPRGHDTVSRRSIPLSTSMSVVKSETTWSWTSRSARRNVCWQRTHHSPGAKAWSPL
jgi:hypothetical protein